MGGDLGPQAAIDGAIIASKKVSNVKFIFFGNKKKIDFYIKKKNLKIFIILSILVKLFQMKRNQLMH